MTYTLRIEQTETKLWYVTSSEFPALQIAHRDLGKALADVPHVIAMLKKR